MFKLVILMCSGTLARTHIPLSLVFEKWQAEYSFQNITYGPAGVFPTLVNMLLLFTSFLHLKGTVGGSKPAVGEKVGKVWHFIERVEQAVSESKLLLLKCCTSLEYFQFPILVLQLHYFSDPNIVFLFHYIYFLALVAFCSF